MTHRHGGQRDKEPVEDGAGRATVFKAVGGKAVVLKLAFDMAIAGDDAPVPVYERPEAKRIEAEPDPYKALEVFAYGVADRAARMAPIYWAIVEAAGADAQAKQLLDEVDAQRDRAGQLLVEELARKGALREGVDRTRGAQILSVFLEPAAYRILVLHHGWTLTRFSTWLYTTLADQLLPRS